jgi:hypothetical protein
VGVGQTTLIIIQTTLNVVYANTAPIRGPIPTYRYSYP